MKRVNPEEFFTEGFEDAERGKRYHAERICEDFGASAAEAYARGYREGEKEVDRKVAVANYGGKL